MERALQNLQSTVQSAKGVLWDQFCDLAETRALVQRTGHTTTNQDSAGAGCSLCPSESVLSQLDSVSVRPSCCDHRFDRNCLENWMRSSNERRTGLAEGDRFKPVKCPHCRTPMSETVQSIVAQHTDEVLQDTNTVLEKLCRAQFQEVGTVIRSSLDNSSSSVADNTVVATTNNINSNRDSAIASVIHSDTPSVDTLAQTADRRINRTLPSQLTKLVLALPQHATFQDARLCTLAEMLQGELNMVVAMSLQAGAPIDFTNVPLTLLVYSTLASYGEKLQNTQQQPETLLVDPDAAAGCVDDAYRATALMVEQSKAEVTQHLEMAKLYEPAINTARVGVEMVDESSGASESAATDQWIAFQQASAVMSAFKLIEKNAQALSVTAQEAVKASDSAGADTILPTIGRLNESIDSLSKFVHTLRRHEEGVVRYEMAVQSHSQALHSEVQSAAETLAREVIALIDPGSLVASSSHSTAANLLAEANGSDDASGNSELMSPVITDTSDLLASTPVERALKDNTGALPEVAHRSELSAATSERSSRFAEISASAASDRSTSTSAQRLVAANGYR